MIGFLLKIFSCYGVLVPCEYPSHLGLGLIDISKMAQHRSFHPSDRGLRPRRHHLPPPLRRRDPLGPILAGPLAEVPRRGLPAQAPRPTSSTTSSARWKSAPTSAPSGSSTPSDSPAWRWRWSISATSAAYRRRSRRRSSAITWAGFSRRRMGASASQRRRSGSRSGGRMGSKRMVWPEVDRTAPGWREGQGAPSPRNGPKSAI
jgi:hypothetical protein